MISTSWRDFLFADRYVVARLWVIAVLATLLNYYLSAALFPLTDLDEGAYSGVTREMFVRRDWLATYLNGEPWFEKPILMYWMQSIGVAIFGVNEWGFRLPSAAASTIWFAVIYRFVAVQVNVTTALLAVIVTATALGTCVIYKAAIPDPFLNLFLSAVLFDIYRYWQTPESRLVYRVFLSMGLGVLAKGPVAMVLPFAIGLLFFTLQGGFWRFARAVVNPVGWLIWLAVVMPWHAYQYYRFGDTFINEYFFKHNVGRFAASLDGHAGNVLYYVVFLFVLSFPFFRPLVQSLYRIPRSLSQLRQQPFTLFLLVWFCVVLVFFSVASTKLPHYLMYGMVPVFILIAVQVGSAHKRERAWKIPVAALFFSVLVCALPFVLQWVAPQQPDRFYQDALANAGSVVDIGFILKLMLCLGMLALFWYFRPVDNLTKAALTGLVVSGQISLLLMPALIGMQQQPLKDAAEFAVARDIHPVMWKLNMPSFGVYAQRNIPRRKPQPSEWVVTKSHIVAHDPDYAVAFNRGGIALAQRVSQ